MKKIFISLFAVLSLLFVGCSSKDNVKASLNYGEKYYYVQSNYSDAVKYNSLDYLIFDIKGNIGHGDGNLSYIVISKEEIIISIDNTKDFNSGLYYTKTSKEVIIMDYKGNSIFYITKAYSEKNNIPASTEN